MSYRQQNQNRRARRDNLNAPSSTSISQMDLPGPLKLLANRKLFFALAAIGRHSDPGRDGRARGQALRGSPGDVHRHVQDLHGDDYDSQGRD